jgi:hypothetical protein
MQHMWRASGEDACQQTGLPAHRNNSNKVKPPAGEPCVAADIGDWQDWPWSLMDYLPSAARAAGGRPSLVIWHFQLPAS